MFDKTVSFSEESDLFADYTLDSDVFADYTLDSDLFADYTLDSDLFADYTLDSDIFSDYTLDSAYTCLHYELPASSWFLSMKGGLEENNALVNPLQSVQGGTENVYFSLHLYT